MKPFSIPVFRPAKFGASAAEIAVVTNELRERINKRLKGAGFPEGMNHEITEFIGVPTTHVPNTDEK